MYLKIDSIKKSYGTGDSRVDVLKGVNCGVKKGEICVLLGPSGSGKSTLLNILGGIDKADSGSVTIGDDKLENFNDKHRILLKQGFTQGKSHLNSQRVLSLIISQFQGQEKPVLRLFRIGGGLSIRELHRLRRLRHRRIHHLNFRQMRQRNCWLWWLHGRSLRSCAYYYRKHSAG